MGAIAAEESAWEERKERSIRCGAEGGREDEGAGAKWMGMLNWRVM